MKLNNSFNSKQNYYSQTAGNPAHPISQTICYGSNENHLSQTRPNSSSYYNNTQSNYATSQAAKKRSMSNTRGTAYPASSYNFATVDHNYQSKNNERESIGSPKILYPLNFQYNQVRNPDNQRSSHSKLGLGSRSKIQSKENLKRIDQSGLLQDKYDIVNQTIQPYYERENFQSIQVNNYTKGSRDAINFNAKYDEIERALSYNLLKQNIPMINIKFRAHKTIQQVEKECEIKIEEEKKRFKEKENDNKIKIKQLVSKIESEKDKRLADLTNYTDIKKKNLELRKRISELIFENNQLTITNQQQSNQINSLTKQNDVNNQQLQQIQQQVQQLQSKYTKKLLKRETRIDEIKDEKDQDIRRLQKELNHLQQQNKELEFELYSYKKTPNREQITIQDQTAYEDRIKQLLLDLENQSKKYINEISCIHEQYRGYITRCGELEERIKVIQVDCDQAINNERNLNKENVRLKLQNEEFIKKIQRLNSTINDLKYQQQQQYEATASLQLSLQKQQQSAASNYGVQKQCQRCNVQMMQTIQQSDYGSSQQDIGRDYRTNQNYGEKNYDNYSNTKKTVNFEKELIEDEEAKVISNGRDKKATRQSNNQDEKSPIQSQTKPQKVTDKEPDSNQVDSAQSKPKKPKIEQTQQEQQVLSNLVENIQQNSALCNGHIRRLFSLQNILFKGNKLISKNQMMDELSEYDNLIRAMGALFYTSKRMGDQIPCIFQAWKEHSFEQRAKKIRNLLSESQVQNHKHQQQQQQQMQQQYQQSNHGHHQRPSNNYQSNQHTKNTNQYQQQQQYQQQLGNPFSNTHPNPYNQQNQLNQNQQQQQQYMNDSLNQRDSIPFSNAATSYNHNNNNQTNKYKNVLGDNGMTIAYDQNQSELGGGNNDYLDEIEREDEYRDEYEDDDDEDDILHNPGEEEEFMKVHNNTSSNNNGSYSILPMTNLKALEKRHDSQYEDGEDEDISIDDEDQEDQQENQENKQQKWEFNEDDPEVQNAKLLEKYAQMQGVTMDQMMSNLQDGGDDNEGEGDDDQQQMIFVDENGQELDHQTVMMMMNQEGLVQGPDGQFYYQGGDAEDDEMLNQDDDNDIEEDLVYQDIITADDYINDDEEAQAKLIREKQKLKEKILHQPSTSNEGSAQRKAGGRKINQLAYYEEMDEDGNLYLFEKKN